ncbi:MAG: type II toxin-antitoxin system RelE/ParE family toxin [Caulobacteraceae bacterium]|nr:type II toxin-antitoxin system RelE/ParE family toxin [Caulobacter sp.]
MRLRPELLDDVAEASGWYEAQSEGLGLDFTRAFFAAVARASLQPISARVVYAGFRRVRLRRFPHSLFYRAEAAETVFFLLFHGARNPDLLRRTLRARRSTP